MLDVKMIRLILETMGRWNTEYLEDVFLKPWAAPNVATEGITVQYFDHISSYVQLQTSR